MITPNKFISILRESFDGSVKVYTGGSCFQLFKILKGIFPNARPFWNMHEQHCITKIDGKYYDIEGVVKDSSGYFEIIPGEQDFVSEIQKCEVLEVN